MVHGHPQQGQDLEETNADVLSALKHYKALLLGLLLPCSALLVCLTHIVP